MPDAGAASPRSHRETPRSLPARTRFAGPPPDVSTGRGSGGDFPREAENGSIGGLPSVSLTESLHPSFEPWFREHLPDVPFDGARAGARSGLRRARRCRSSRATARRRPGDLGEDAVRRTVEAKDRFDRVVSRQAIIVESIERHAGLSDELRARILATFDPDALEDLYHPYRQQKKNRALAAREAGLQPLADWIWDTGHGTETPQEGQTLELWAFTFRSEEKGIADAKAAIEGARDILVERLASDPELRALVRRTYLETGVVRATKTDKAKPGSKFEGYFTFEEKVAILREAAASRPLPRRAPRPVGGGVCGRRRGEGGRLRVRATSRGGLRVAGLHRARRTRRRGAAPRRSDRVQERRPHVGRERGPPHPEGRRRRGGGSPRSPRTCASCCSSRRSDRSRSSASTPARGTAVGPPRWRARARSPAPRSCISRRTSRRRRPPRRSFASRARRAPSRWRSATAPAAARPRSSRARRSATPGSTCRSFW